MIESVYAKRLMNAETSIVDDAAKLTAALGVDPGLVNDVQTVKGNNARLRLLARMEGIAALMGALADASMKIGSPDPDAVKIEEVLAVSGLSKTSKEKITAALRMHQ